MTNFDWGWMSGTSHQDIIISELSQDIYQKVFKVEPGDIVLDLGASVGIFPYYLANSGFKHMFCFEPSYDEFCTLVKNTLGMPVTHINAAMTNKTGWRRIENVFNNGNTYPVQCYTLHSFFLLFGIEKVDFIKMDIEGHEYDIFVLGNVPILKERFKKIVIEFHLKGDFNEKFIWFRDNVLSLFKNFDVYSIDGVNIKWDLFNEHFTQYYTEVIIHIDNR